MNTISVVECNGSMPSLRSCGSSYGGLIQNRSLHHQLQDRPIGRRASIPAMRRLTGRESAFGLSISPLLGRQQAAGVQAVRSSQRSDGQMSRPGIQPGSRAVRQIETRGELQVVGLQPQISSMFDISANRKKGRSQKALGEQADYEPLERTKSSDDRHSSALPPENPPPSPINFEPSLENFVVGGTHLECSNSKNNNIRYNSRDFVPGVFKHPLSCLKATSQDSKFLIAHRKSLTTLRESLPILSRDKCYCQTPGLTGSQVIQSINRSTSEQNARQRMNHDRLLTFLELYARPKMSEPTQIKAEEKDGLDSARAEHDSCSDVTLKNSLLSPEDFNGNTAKDEEHYSYSSSSFDGSDLVSEVDQTHAELLKEQLESAGSTPTKSEVINNATSDTSLRSLQEMMEDDSTLKQEGAEDFEVDCALDVNKGQLRRCWSDIWPISRNLAESDLYKDLPLPFIYDARGSRSGQHVDSSRPRTSPFAALALLSPKTDGESNLDDMSSCLETELQNLANSDTTLVTQPLPQTPVQSVSVSKSQSAKSTHSTKALCSQWKNLSPTVEQSPVPADDFLDQFQRAQLLQSPRDKSIPAAQQFCFEAMIDKRYNRWKRQRRRINEQGYTSKGKPDSSSDSDTMSDRVKEEMEKIIDKMYEEIHGMARTPNGSQDTPRVRNRRRRKETVPVVVIKTVENKNTASRPTESRSRTSNNSPIGKSPSNSSIGKYPSNPSIGKHPSNSSIGRNPSNSPIGKNPSNSSIGRNPSNSPICKTPSNSSTGRNPNNSPRGRNPNNSPKGRNSSNSPISSNSADIYQIGSSTDVSVRISSSALCYDASSEMTSSDTNCGNRSSSVQATPHSECGPILSRASVATSDSCSLVYIERYKDEMMKTISSTPPEILDEMLANDWLPEIDRRSKSRLEYDNQRAEQLKKSYPQPLVADRASGDRSKSPDKLSISMTNKGGRQDVKLYQKLSRSPKQNLMTVKDPEAEPKKTSKTKLSVSGNTPVEPKVPEVACRPIPAFRLNMKQPRAVVKRRAFRETLKPIDISIGSSTTYPVEPKRLKGIINSYVKSRTQSLPNIQHQRRNNPVLNNKENSLKKEIQDASRKAKERTLKPIAPGPHKKVSKPQVATEVTEPGLMFNDSYLRAVSKDKPRDTRRRPRRDRSVQKMKLCKKRLQSPEHRKTKASPENDCERQLSNLSFTRSFTFSAFTLPDTQKKYNKRITRRAACLTVWDTDSSDGDTT